MGMCNISLIFASVEGKRRCYDWMRFHIQVEVECPVWGYCLATFSALLATFVTFKANCNWLSNYFF